MRAGHRGAAACARHRAGRVEAAHGWRSVGLVAESQVCEHGSQRRGCQGPRWARRKRDPTLGPLTWSACATSVQEREEEVGRAEEKYRLRPSCRQFPEGPRASSDVQRRSGKRCWRQHDRGRKEDRRGHGGHRGSLDVDRGQARWFEGGSYFGGVSSVSCGCSFQAVEGA